LGLSLARAIAEAHNGGIKVQSAPNQGSTFQVFLPLQK
jgi:signal transduction histidine kinase